MANDDGDEDAEWADAAEDAEGADAADDTGDDADGDDGADNYDDDECDDAGDENGGDDELVIITMTMMLRRMLTVILGMKMHEYDNDGDDGDDLFFSELSIH